MAGWWEKKQKKKTVKLTVKNYAVISQSANRQKTINHFGSYLEPHTSVRQQRWFDRSHYTSAFHYGTALDVPFSPFLFSPSSVGRSKTYQLLTVQLHRRHSSPAKKKTNKKKTQ